MISAMSSQSGGSLNMSLDRMIIEYHGDLSGVNLETLSSIYDLGHQDEENEVNPRSGRHNDDVEPEAHVPCRSSIKANGKNIHKKGEKFNVRTLSKKVVSLFSSNSKIKKEVEEAKSSVAETKKVSKEVIDKLVGLEDEVTRLRASLNLSEVRLSQTDERLTDALERLDKDTDEAVIQTRGAHETLFVRLYRFLES
ncbi:hypothetical protein Ddye_008230 [Dipteronia dyeriana]|uniref:Uncharacterized protein n=1 Tax=Dipteronia dyeriana TaxID=168575 RepID=A0AAD9X9Y6_9ROSI|nr:hypothetical protein Ddye_008230 [Dipteronia dyeriana]